MLFILRKSKKHSLKTVKTLDYRLQLLQRNELPPIGERDGIKNPREAIEVLSRKEVFRLIKVTKDESDSPKLPRKSRPATR